MAIHECMVWVQCNECMYKNIKTKTKEWHTATKKNLCAIVHTYIISIFSYFFSGLLIGYCHQHATKDDRKILFLFILAGNVSLICKVCRSVAWAGGGERPLPEDEQPPGGRSRGRQPFRLLFRPVGMCCGKCHRQARRWF